MKMIVASSAVINAVMIDADIILASCKGQCWYSLVNGMEFGPSSSAEVETTGVSVELVVAVLPNHVI